MCGTQELAIRNVAVRFVPLAGHPQAKPHVREHQLVPRFGIAGFDAASKIMLLVPAKRSMFDHVQ